MADVSREEIHEIKNSMAVLVIELRKLKRLEGGAGEEAAASIMEAANELRTLLDAHFERLSG